MTYWTPSTISGELRGRPLRYLLITFLAEAQGPLSVPELISRCKAEGVEFDGRASKIISDAIRWEVRSGRAKRLRRGVYSLGRVPRTTMRWIRQRCVQTKFWLDWVGSQPVQASLGPQTWAWDEGAWVPAWPLWPTPR